MTQAMANVGAWMLQQAAALQDTIVMRPVVAQRGWFEQLTAVASGIVTIAFLVLVVALAPAAWNFRKSFKRISDLLDRIYGDINPLMRHASSIADNVDYITTSIRTDVQQINATIATANQRLRAAMSLTESRLREFEALMGVVQEEAEQMFVSTASTVRGVKTGAAAFRGPGGTEFAMDEFDDLDEAIELELDAEDELAFESQLQPGDTANEEMNDGDPGETGQTHASGDSAARPRVRRRTHGND